MALVFSKNIPIDRYKVISDYLSSLLSSGMSNIIGSRLLPNLFVSEGYQTYNISLKSLIDGKPLDNLQVGHWRHLLLDQNKALYEIDLLEEENNSIRVVAIHESPRAEGTRKAFEIAENLEDVKNSDFEIRFLQCFSSNFMSLWLHSNSEANDIIIPIEPNQTELKNYQAYTLNQVILVLQPIAVKVEKVISSVNGNMLGG